MKIRIEDICPDIEDFPYISATVLLDDIIDFPDTLQPSVAVHVYLPKSDERLSELRRTAFDQARSLLSAALKELDSVK